MNNNPDNDTKLDIQTGVSDILSIIPQEREREIITRRFGLYDRRETLEQIGELLGITRERVRQIEKAIVSKLRLAALNGKLPVVATMEKAIIRNLTEMGRTAKLSDLTDRLTVTKNNQRLQAHVSFVSELCTNLTIIPETDLYYHSIGIAEYGDAKKLKAGVDKIVEVIKQVGEPMSIEALNAKLSFEHPDHVRALASTSKLLAHLGDMWGLLKWPTVNPKNIRDKIFVILTESGAPMHFGDIAKTIKDSTFKRKNVTAQAIHNELIKDPRFVLIGRGIYALDNWGFARGSVADIIAGVLKASDVPLHREEIVKRVLLSRQVKRTTVLLNLQNKPQFKRVDKAIYTYEEK